MIPLKDENPTGRFPFITVLLIASNVAAFVWQVAVEGLMQSAMRGGVLPVEILTFVDVGAPALVPLPFTVFTSMFLHGGLAHLGGNMLFLWVFGDNVEHVLGSLRFLLFYVVAGLVAAVAQTLVAALTGNVMIPMVGASGAIAGVLAGYVTLFPRARVLTLVPIFIFIRLTYLPAYFFIGIWFVFQLISAAFVRTSGGGVAFFAHIGGFVAGLVLIRAFGGRRYRGR